jgi:hypothetical protein
VTAGVFPGIPYEEYARWPGLRSSYLREFRRSPLHARHKALYPPQPSAALELGNATHTAILEPELFEQRYACAPKIDRRFSEGKAAWAAFQREHGHKQILEEKEWTAALGMRDAIWRQPWAQALLAGRGATELSVRWEDPELGAPCQARIDRFVADFDGVATVCDLKSAADAGRDAFRAAIERFGYGLQAAFYLDGLAAAASPHFRQWMWIAVEKTAPYAAALYVADDEILDEGRRLYRTAIAAHLECERSGFWPGYSPRPQIIGRPPWARRPMEDAL